MLRQEDTLSTKLLKITQFFLSIIQKCIRRERVNSLTQNRHSTSL